MTAPQKESAPIDKDKIVSILATDCGSTTTKCILIEKVDGEFRLQIRGEAPTTVEKPVEDVSKGVINAITEVQELAGRKLLDGEKIIKPRKGNDGVDIYISTSSAGGGLQMMVGGVVKQMTAESAARAALGAGAIVMDTLATNDGRLPFQNIERIRHLRPDMMLLAGGVDGGTIEHVIKLCEIVAAADPKPRLGDGYELPIIFAGNKEAVPHVKDILGAKCALDIADNLRPEMDRENLMPARLKIQDQFLEHVMQHAPGYPNLMAMTDAPIMPTPGAVGSIMQTIASKYNIQVLGVDIGGATTDVFSVFQGIFNRTVSANLGMSYSISNVFAEAGLRNIMRWVPFPMDEVSLRNAIKNKMIRPTTIPQLLEELFVEQAAAREALRLSLEQHKSLAVGLKGVQQQRDVSAIFDQAESGQTLVNMMTLNMIIGSGGVLSHAPRRVQSALMMIDSFSPEGVTRLAVDSIFMMPQLGVLAQVHPEASTQVFEKDCLIQLGTVVAPVGTLKEGQDALRVRLQLPGGKSEDFVQKFGQLRLIPLADGQTAKATLSPMKKLNVGAGPGVSMDAELHGGVVGLIIDTRGRPIAFPEDDTTRIAKLREWNAALDVYPQVGK
jgi:uncharacterized protein (TIGR01319 family)